MAKDTADYEKSEEMAITSGKKALERAPWLFDRRDDRSKGFFVELRRNNVVHPGYLSVHCVDGNGTKLFLSAWSDNYRLAPIDGLAMNANDMATIIHAFPSELSIYMACQTPVEEQKMGEIMNGFVDGIERINIPNAPWRLNIGKMETASLDEMISLGLAGKGVDFGIVMNGYIPKDKVPNLSPRPGQLIVGVSSTGLHSNGFTGARHVVFTPEVEPREEWKGQYKGRFRFNDRPSVLEGQTVLEAMQTPTALYLVEAALIGQQFDNREIYGVNITGNGLHNFNRVGSDVAFEITDPLPLLPIHRLLIEESGWNPQKAYTKQNNGMGFAYIFPTFNMAEQAVKLINQRGENRAQIVGEVAHSAKGETELRTTIHKPYDGALIDFVGYNG
jgi:phosphoribosylformylglycinamidine cyclo-ligase